MRITKLSTSLRAAGKAYLRSRPSISLRLGLVAIMTWFGVVFLAPAVNRAGEGWAMFRAIASDHEWSAWFFFVALFGAVGLVARDRWLRLLGTGVLTSGQLSLALCFYVAKPNGPWGLLVFPGTVTYFLIALLGMDLFIHQMFDHAIPRR